MMLNLEAIKQRAEQFRTHGKRSGQWASSEEAFCGPDGPLHELVAEVERLQNIVDGVVHIADRHRRPTAAACQEIVTYVTRQQAS